MIVDGLGREEIGDGQVLRTATFRLDEGRVEPITITLPREFDRGPEDDGTAALPFALLVSMRLGEELDLQGRVDPELLARTDDIQRYYLACNRDGLHEITVRTHGPLDVERPVARAAGCLSRGLDSLFQAAWRRSAAGPLDALVFVDSFEPRHSEAVRAQERELAARAAELIGLPLITVDARVRHLSDSYFDWDDGVAAGMAWVAHNLTGGLGRLVIPAGDYVESLAPNGYGPAIDPLLSASRMHLEPGDVSANRMEKVLWLSRHKPELLPILKVCYTEDRSDNCGRCGKCLLAMACLRAAGVLELATGFPSELDLDALTEGPHRLLEGLLQLRAIRAAAERAGDSELADALSEALRMNLAVVPRRPGPQASFRAHHSHRVRVLLEEGRSGGVGLVQGFDPRTRRHVHAAGSTPLAPVRAELGALVIDPGTGRVPLWVLPDGRLATTEISPRGSAPRRGPRVRHAVAGVVRHGAGGWPRGLRSQPLGPAAPEEGQRRAGHVFADPAPDRLALWVGEDPISGDQFSASSDREILQAGYPRPRLLGYLLARAPVTGRLGVHPRAQQARPTS